MALVIILVTLSYISAIGQLIVLLGFPSPNKLSSYHFNFGLQDCALSIHFGQMTMESCHSRESTLQNLKPGSTRRGLLIVNKTSQYNGLEFRVFAAFTIFKRRLLAEFTVFTVGLIITTLSIFIVFTMSKIFTVFRIHPILHDKK